MLAVWIFVVVLQLCITTYYWVSNHVTKNFYSYSARIIQTTIVLKVICWIWKRSLAIVLWHPENNQLSSVLINWIFWTLWIIILRFWVYTNFVVCCFATIILMPHIAKTKKMISIEIINDAIFISDINIRGACTFRIWVYKPQYLSDCLLLIVCISCLGMVFVHRCFFDASLDHW